MLNFIGLLEQTLQYSSVQLIAYAFFPFSTDQQSHEDDWIPHLKATKDKRNESGKHLCSECRSIYVKKVTSMSVECKSQILTSYTLRIKFFSSPCQLSSSSWKLQILFNELQSWKLASGTCAKKTDQQGPCSCILPAFTKLLKLAAPFDYNLFFKPLHTSQSCTFPTLIKHCFHL